MARKAVVPAVGWLWLERGGKRYVYVFWRDGGITEVADAARADGPQWREVGREAVTGRYIVHWGSVPRWAFESCKEKETARKERNRK